MSQFQLSNQYPTCQSTALAGLVCQKKFGFLCVLFFPVPTLAVLVHEVCTRSLMPVKLRAESTIYLEGL